MLQMGSRFLDMGSGIINNETCDLFNFIGHSFPVINPVYIYKKKTPRLGSFLAFSGRLCGTSPFTYNSSSWKRCARKSWYLNTE